MYELDEEPAVQTLVCIGKGDGGWGFGNCKSVKEIDAKGMVSVTC